MQKKALIRQKENQSPQVSNKSTLK